MSLNITALGNRQAYLKCGMFGFQASGKTRTATEIAIGLAKYLKSQKPIFFFDTEVGSNFVEPIYRKNGLELIGIQSRAFIDLVGSIHYAADVCDIMIIDSVTHVWVELCDAYRRKRYECRKCENLTMLQRLECSRCNGTGAITDRLSVWDYAPIKKEWARFVDLMLNSRLHIIVCGRAGNEYESQENIEGKLEILKSGTKFKAESEFGYETSLLIEMRKEKMDKGIENVAFVWKDRFDVINGKEFRMPKFEDFLPHIERLNLGGEHISIEHNSSVEALKTPAGSSEEYTRQRTIILEEIQAAINLRFPSSGAVDKRCKAETLKTIFGTLSWTAVESMGLDILQAKSADLFTYLTNYGVASLAAS